MTRAPLVDVDAAVDEAFALASDYGPFVSDRHAHDKHQLLYAAHGTMLLRTDARVFILPPQRGALIPARTAHVVESKTGIALRTVYLSPAIVPWDRRDAALAPRIFPITPLAREMIVHATRWGPLGAPEAGAARAPFFRALAALLVEWVAAEEPYFLPAAKSRELARAMEWIGAHLEDATLERAARAARMSARTLTRRFEDEAETSFRAYLKAARMMRAMELLAEPGAQVTTVAFAVGFQSAGAFTASFSEHCHETPSEYRARVRAKARLQRR